MSTSQPNVLVFFTDQQRWDTCGCYGNPMGLTPNLDALAGRGTRFEHAFTCQPVCAPARASLQTGLYATAAGVWRNGIALPQDRATLAQCFNQAGYETAYIGKWHLSSAGHGQVPAEGRAGYQYWIASNVLEFTSHPCDGVIYDSQGKPIRLKGFRVDAQTDLAIDFLRQPRSAPFFLCLSYLEPHFQNDMRRFVAPDGYAQRYADPYVPPDLLGHSGDWKQELPDYYGLCAKLDESLGRLLAELDRLGQADNTVLIFISDHGCHFRTRNSEYKRSCHESSIRIPLVIDGPGFRNGRVVPNPVSLVDVPPTILSAAGVPVPPVMQGADLAPLSRGQGQNWRDEVFVQISEDHVGRAIRTGRWKYCAVAPGKDGWKDQSSDSYVERELYDLSADPYEQTNRIADPAMEPVIQHLRRRLRERIVEAGEPEAIIHPHGS